DVPSLYLARCLLGAFGAARFEEAQIGACLEQLLAGDSAVSGSVVLAAGHSCFTRVGFHLDVGSVNPRGGGGAWARANLCSNRLLLCNVELKGPAGSRPWHWSPGRRAGWGRRLRGSWRPTTSCCSGHGPPRAWHRS